MSDHFRRCASVVLLQEMDNEDGEESVQVLLVHKPRRCDAWQLPQGGAEEKESIEEAALRELHEETGLDGHVLATSNICYQYRFPASYRRFRPDDVCGQCVQFVFARPVSDPIVTVDNNEIDGYVWAKPSEIERYIEREEYLDVVRRLVGEGIDLLRA